ncbi:MAG: 3-hydroxyacyl-CoA dehydrogenase NAD-binding domain-containing protein, partial [Coriobacteriia bacterium]
MSVIVGAKSLKKEIKKITVIGSGIMGRGIVYAALLGGFSVTLNDISQELLEQARAYILKTLQKGVELGKVTQESLSS